MRLEFVVILMKGGSKKIIENNYKINIFIDYDYKDIFFLKLFFEIEVRKNYLRPKFDTLTITRSTDTAFKIFPFA